MLRRFFVFFMFVIFITSPCWSPLLSSPPPLSLLFSSSPSKQIHQFTVTIAPTMARCAFDHGKNQPNKSAKTIRSTHELVFVKFCGLLGVWQYDEKNEYEYDYENVDKDQQHWTVERLQHQHQLSTDVQELEVA